MCQLMITFWGLTNTDTSNCVTPTDKRIMKKIQLEFEKSTQTTTVVYGGTPIKQEDSVWPPLKAGLFGGDIQRFRNVKQEFDSSIKWPPQRWI